MSARLWLPAMVAVAAGLALAAPATAAGTVGNFAFGQLQATTPHAGGCGTNPDGEPSVHVSRANTLMLGSERGLGGGSDVWTQASAVGGSGAVACAPTYQGQPNAVQGFGVSGGDIDTAFGSATNAVGNYPMYVASLNLGSVSVAHSDDNGVTWSNTPVQGGLPGDDREWIAAYGSSTSLLTFHDVSTNDIDVLRSDNEGMVYTEISQAIPETDYKAGANELGNIVVDHRNTAGTVPGTGGATGFWAYQSFVAPSNSSGSNYNEAFVAVSNDGGYTWTDKPVPCSVSSRGLDHIFPNVSVAPNGTLWETWSDDSNVFTATSADHGSTWTCSNAVSSGTSQAVMPWIVATSAGVDLVYYGAVGSGSSQTWYVYFVQNTANTPTGWGSPQQTVSVHTGAVCEGGIGCSGNRQLLDDFGVDTDQSGWAHIAYSHDSPDLGGSSTYTGYEVQTAGTPVGFPN